MCSNRRVICSLELLLLNSILRLYHQLSDVFSTICSWRFSVARCPLPELLQEKVFTGKLLFLMQPPFCFLSFLSFFFFLNLSDFVNLLEVCFPLCLSNLKGQRQICCLSIVTMQDIMKPCCILTLPCI